MTQKSANSKCLKFDGRGGGGGRGSSWKNKNINYMQYTTCKSLALHHIAHHYGVINRLFISSKNKTMSGEALRPMLHQLQKFPVQVA